ncbi:MAG: hypothetical protein P8M22_12760 [Phycisphaerales bacterium]|nr:hypothetical protein [Phycisphaerales bacterium]
MASRFGNSSGQASQGGQVNVYTVLTLVGFLIMLVGVVWMIFHNMDYSKDFTNGSEGGVFAILDQGR